MTSCELLCIAIEAEVKKVLKKHGCKLHKFYVRVRPRLETATLNYAFMEYQASYSRRRK